VLRWCVRIALPVFWVDLSRLCPRCVESRSFTPNHFLYDSFAFYLTIFGLGKTGVKTRGPSHASKRFVMPGSRGKWEMLCVILRVVAT
jgi:hypothetical protein